VTNLLIVLSYHDMKSVRLKDIKFEL